ncbi:MAG: SDR family oxidoreductase [Proteobacteria bacterium]|nr:SDR family oxidoreductase [Pseudomonadota bacterium]
MDLGIAGRRAAVAGGSSGLGLGTALALAEEGVRVAICGRDAERLGRAAERLPAGSVALSGDVSTPEGSRSFVREAREALGGLDILVANAGGPPAGNFATTEVDAYPDAISLNLLSVVAMCKEAVPPMQEQRWGRVLAITSISVRQPIGNLILSNTARAGATGFLKTLALEVAGDGVTVNSLQPGFHDTPRVRQIAGGDEESVRRMGAQVPVGFMGSADDFGRAAAFLCSEHARFITGAAVPVDGGAYTALL